MRKYLILLLVVLLGIGELSAQSKKKEYRYEVAPVSVGAQGTYLIKVSACLFPSTMTPIAMRWAHMENIRLIQNRKFL